MELAETLEEAIETFEEKLELIEIVDRSNEGLVLSTNTRALELLDKFLDSPCVEETDKDVKENLLAIKEEINDVNYEKFTLEDKVKLLNTHLEELYKEYNLEEKRLRTTYGN